MGKVEKVIVLSVLTLIALILVVSWTVDDPIHTARASDKAKPADAVPAATAPASLASGSVPGATSPAVVQSPAQPPLSAPTAAPSPLLSTAVNGLPPGALLKTLDGLEDSYLPDMKFYTWREGDSYRLVSHRYYGDYRKLTLLRKVNEGRTDVKPGQKIFVPVFDIEGGDAFVADAGAATSGATSGASSSATKPETRVPASDDAKTASAKKDAKSSKAVEEATPASASGKRVHVVKEGESLWKIAKIELGSGARWKEIYEANRDVLSSPEAVKKGQKLRIP